ncbi:MAG: response regulator, partial [Candidatus Omnitrophica bacterium]|nr:response regulator [Candidatus Omnitrophota bacterium]
FLKTYGMPVPEEFQASTKKRILIVDDDRGMVHSLRRALMMDNKYLIEVAYDGFQAGRRFSDFKPDFIILDICMPGLDGYQVCEYIRHSDGGAKVKILVITAMGEGQEIKKIMDLGADDFLRKPFNNEVLRQKIKDMLGEKNP